MSNKDLAKKLYEEIFKLRYHWSGDDLVNHVPDNEEFAEKLGAFLKEFAAEIVFTKPEED